MELILWRHAEAVDSAPDMARELTPKGRLQAQKMAAFLQQHLPAETRILVSPATRTRQTVAALTDKFTIVNSLAPNASAHAILQAARWPQNSEPVLIVGHQPTLGAVAALLLGSAENALSIKKGALWWFSRRERDDTAQTTLRLAITPEML
ncbi:MAG: phosphohistidine phosphatase SixA [Sideroxydans sp.]|nr:phosphohistidine phosphatase SixA [Sideroxydans sp.]